MKTHLLAAGFLLLACGPKQDARPLIHNPEKAFSERIGSFSRSSEIRIYGRESLWEYNDGAAERFLELGFTKMATADYTEDSLEYTAEIYTFENPAGAAAIYGDNFTPGERIIEIGDGGFVAEGLLLFYSANAFAQITCYSPNPPDAKIISLSRVLWDNLKLEQGK